MSYIRKSFQQRPNTHLLQQDRGLAYTVPYAHPPKSQYIPRARYVSSNEKKYDYQNQINGNCGGMEVKEDREGHAGGRVRTPSAGDHGRYKYQASLLSVTEAEIQGGVSHGKLKRIAKNYATGIGGTNFGEFGTTPNSKNGGTSTKNKYGSGKDEHIYIEPQRKQNINTRNYQPQSQHQHQQKQQSQSQQISQYQYQNQRNFQFTSKQYQRENKDRSYSKKYNEDQAIKDSFQRANQEKILQKIGRINKLNLEINDRLQKILAKVSIE